MACIRRSGPKYGSQDELVSSSLDKEKSIVQIYTDWANHYLERGSFKRFIQDLQNDVSDGVLLADVIESVTGSKVPEIVRKPKGPSQMVDNIKICVSFLGDLGVNVEGIVAKDIKEGHLKAILSLFFNLSRFKQAQKTSISAQIPLSVKNSQDATSSTAQGENASRLPSSSNCRLSLVPRPEAPQQAGSLSSCSKDPMSSIPAPSVGCILSKKSSLPENSNKVYQSFPVTNSNNSGSFELDLQTMKMALVLRRADACSRSFQKIGRTGSNN